MAVIDVAGFVAEQKEHAIAHGFHVHDERHFVETYSLRQAWEVDLHPEEACGGPLDLHLALEVDPRVLLAFEDQMLELPESSDPVEGLSFPLVFTWVLPPLLTCVPAAAGLSSEQPTRTAVAAARPITPATTRFIVFLPHSRAAPMASSWHK